MTKPVLRWLHSADLLDMEHDFPPDPFCFSLPVQAGIGSNDGPGEDTFEFVVCTPTWLAERVSDGHHVFGFPYLIVSEYRYEHIFGAISTLCSRIVGTTWQEVAAQLGRYGQWEFEDYVQPI